MYCDQLVRHIGVTVSQGIDDFAYWILSQLGGAPSPAQPMGGPMGGLGDLFSLSGGPGISGGMYSAPKQVRDNFFRLIYSARA